MGREPREDDCGRRERGAIYAESTEEGGGPR
jgi:hypothetical protein